MGYTVVIGLQWGDEGKGKVIDYLSRDFYAVVRFQGGANAGHTVYLDGEAFVFHLLPTGLLRKDKRGVIGAGVLIDPAVMMEEIEWITERTGPLKGRFFIDGRTHIVLPHHREEDQWEEELKGGIGTTKRGIGPAYRDLYARFGVRLVDLLGNDFEKRLDRVIDFNNQILGGRYGKPPILKRSVLKTVVPFVEVVREFVENVPYLLERWDSEGKNMLLEGAQGTLLDIFFGTYPFVTSSHTVSGGASVGAGIPPQKLGRAIGVMKAYTTRVGGGPFPTELRDDVGKRIRKVGNEFGATTGRARRCGWLDLVAAKYSVMLNGVEEVVLTKLDVLSGLSKVKVAVSYRIDGIQTDRFPMDPSILYKVEPIYEELDGWSNSDVEGKIKGNALKYIKFVEEFLGVDVSYVSVGKEREEMIGRPSGGWV